ncbi:MAG: riboflavin synthase [Epsilonproteobacteria bacterium]|nr:riboflavin synthase [Campylobacterota bacterium]
MFTGLIREKAKVLSFTDNILQLKAKHSPKLGDSIAVNGVCLTVIKVSSGEFAVEISPETKAVVAMENYKNEVHIEPAMKLSDRLEGHIVQGHVDTIGVVKKIEKTENSYDFFIGIDKEFIKFVVPKGSITIDGVSLTVNDVYTDSFRLTIIPHTVENTLFKNYKVGFRVNIETDMFARYIYHMFSGKKSMSWDDVDKIMARY